MIKPHYLLASLLLLSTTSVTIAQTPGRTLVASSGSSHVELLELYSSEGCSSCPPADHWVSELKNQPDLWKRFVPVVFHVDYWNNGSWKDELSSDAMTKRQVDISQRWPEPSVYTPGVVLDGKEWRSWHDVQSPPAATPNPRKIELNIFRETDGSFTVKVDRTKNGKSLIVRIAELGMGISSNVTGGENSGRTLNHNFAVLDWESQKISSNQSESSFKFKSSNQKVSQTAIAAWVEEEGNPTPLQAAGGYL
jgi:hypothetical protein